MTGMPLCRYAVMPVCRLPFRCRFDPLSLRNRGARSALFLVMAYTPIESQRPYWKLSQVFGESDDESGPATARHRPATAPTSPSKSDHPAALPGGPDPLAGHVQAPNAPGPHPNLATSLRAVSEDIIDLSQEADDLDGTATVTAAPSLGVHHGDHGLPPVAKMVPTVCAPTAPSGLPGPPVATPSGRGRVVPILVPAARGPKGTKRSWEGVAWCAFSAQPQRAVGAPTPTGRRCKPSAPIRDPDNPWIVDLPVDDIVPPGSRYGRFDISSEDTGDSSDSNSSTNSHGSRKSRIT
jgi:hypothetical protein